MGPTARGRGGGQSASLRVSGTSLDVGATRWCDRNGACRLNAYLGCLVTPLLACMSDMRARLSSAGVTGLPPGATGNLNLKVSTGTITVSRLSRNGDGAAQIEIIPKP